MDLPPTLFLLGLSNALFFLGLLKIFSFALFLVSCLSKKLTNNIIRECFEWVCIGLCTYIFVYVMALILRLNNHNYVSIHDY